MKQKSILVIDDEVLLLDLVEECLVDDFQIIVKANTVDMAKDALFERQFDCVLIDIDISGSNGAEIVKMMKEYNPGDNAETPVIIMSGLINEDFKEKFRDKFAGILAKPFKPGDLQAQVLVAVGSSKRSKSNSDLNLISDEPETPAHKERENPLPEGDEVRKVEIEFNNEKVFLDVFNPAVTAPFKIQDLDRKVTKFLDKVQRNPKLSELFKKLKATKDDPYLMTHIGLLINISTGIATQMDWGSEQTLEKFIYASYLHDISLGDSSKLAQYKTKAEFESDDSLSQDAKKLVNLHPLASKTLIEHKNDIPQDVHTIIEQHHEMPDGSGFPAGIDNKRITPLASIFIVSHLLADYIIENEKWKVENFVKKYRSKMKGPHFRKALKCVEGIK
ncbi:response regulator [Bacteriovorax sp. Seq25_V]|uniref:response regulator n=1 Tax=Bacteriovorax sp. Seq25_V TaxID=1201288 RepID=UPI00038A43AA|nr:response regulator [Bacteriovorax sp. Seq25_V]EQC46268.1 response regulator receiver domain protein [Bacteriovorax sp. Seq25_V]